MGDEGGISRATLLHLSFHNKWLSLGKPKQITPTVRAVQDRPKPWSDVCPPAALPVLATGHGCPRTHAAPGADPAEK